MIKGLLFIFFIASLSLTTFSYANTKREQLLSIVNEELREITRLNKQTRSSRPILLLRLAEVLLEKARILKEQENQAFLELSKEKRSNLDRKDFFKGSNKYFIQAQKTCFYIIKKFKNFSKRGDVYFILAYNAKEFSDYKMAKKYFRLAAKNSKKASYTRKRSQIALAEFYFNQQEYAKAVPLYEKALRKGALSDSRWISKDLFNLGWSYFRVGSRKKAIKALLKSYSLGKKKDYIDMSYAIERDLAYFYTASGQVGEAIKFYKRIGGNIANNLVKVGKHLINQGQFTPAESALVEALKYKPTDDLRVEAYFSLLVLYDKYGKTAKHLDISTKLVKEHKAKPLNEDDIKDLKYHLEKYSAVLQKQVAGKLYENVKSTREIKAKQSVGYFMLLSEIDPSKKYSHFYYAGETYYAVKNYPEALDHYAKSRNESASIKNRKFLKMSVIGMLACFEHPKKLGKKRVEKYFPIVTSDFIALNPGSKKTGKLIQRLFSFHMGKKNIARAEEELNRYVSQFPNDVKIHEAMLARVIDFHRVNKDRKSMAKWIMKVKKREVKVSKRYASRLKYMLLAMQFENVEKFNTKGEKKKALEGYFAIFRSPESSSDAKKNAAYNISVLFHELGNMDLMGAWLNRSLDMMSEREISKFSSSLLVMISDLNNQTRFKDAHKLFEKGFKKLCGRKNKSKPFYLLNALKIELFEKDIKVTSMDELVKHFKECRISQDVQFKIIKEILEHYSQRKQISNIELVFKQYYSKKLFFSLTARAASELALASYRDGRSDFKKYQQEAIKFYNKAKRDNQKVDYRTAELLSEFEYRSYEREARRFSEFSFEFPRDKFANLMTVKFKEISGLKKKLDPLYTYGVGDFIIKGNYDLVKAYDSFITKLIGFAPKGFSPENQKMFKKEMRNVGAKLNNDKNKIINAVKELISKEKVRSNANFKFTNRNFLKTPVSVPSLKAIIMDRSGRP